MKTRLCILILISTISVRSQTFSDSLINILKKKSLTETTSFLDASKSKNIRLLLNRQIVSNYAEILYEITDGKGEEIKLLCNADKIVYAKVVSDDKKKFEEKDSAAIKHFYKEYITFFGLKVSINNFFVTNVQYGQGCGFVGVDPPLRKEMIKLVAAKNTKELTKWLQSPVTEKQLYGVEAFNSLEGKGVALTPLQKKLIDFIKTKKGIAKTCNGCIYSDKEISTIFEKK
ncbi:MAG: hypothetical protein ACXVC6_14790 [Bacteroidia bacterium]